MASQRSQLKGRLKEVLSQPEWDALDARLHAARVQSARPVKYLLHRHDVFISLGAGPRSLATRTHSALGDLFLVAN